MAQQTRAPRRRKSIYALSNLIASSYNRSINLFQKEEGLFPKQKKARVYQVRKTPELTKDERTDIDYFRMCSIMAKTPPMFVHTLMRDLCIRGLLEEGDYTITIPK